jgi:ketosteroid isomerase-like protein
VAIGELIDAGDRVVALVRHQGTTPDAQAYDVPSIMVWTVPDGRIAALYEQLDTLAMARATEGVAPAQGAA